MKSLPKISEECICAVIEKITLDTNTTGEITTTLITELAETGNEPLAATLIELMDGILEDDVPKKLMVSAAFLLMLKMVNTTIEAQELKNMFEEAT